MRFNKAIREQVYQKYGGHCAYCGIALNIKDMQVDHFEPLADQYYKGVNPDDLNAISNLMPACRMCNHYKRANSLSTFRRYIEEIPQKLQKDYIYKVGVRYNLIEEKPRKVRFYFEDYEIT